MSERDVLIERLERLLSEKDREIAELRKMLSDKDKFENIKNRIIYEIKRELSTNLDSQKILELESKIVELKRAVESLMNEVMYIKNELRLLITEKKDYEEVAKRVAKKEVTQTEITPKSPKEPEETEKIKEDVTEIDDEEDIIVCD